METREETTRTRNPGAGEMTLDRLVAERADAVKALRWLCSEFGDNDWPDDLHLGDIIEKHLYRYLRNL